MRVIGVDPGLTRCGVGIVEGAPGRTLQLIAVDIVRTSADQPIGERLNTIYEYLDQAICTYAPDRLAIERVFSQFNLTTVMGTAQAAGVATLIGHRHGLPTATYTPTEVKAAVTGSGSADKAQVSRMMQRILRTTDLPSTPDATDALALATTDVWRGSHQRLRQGYAHARQRKP